MKFKRIMSIILTAVTILSTFAIFGSLSISAENGYDRGYKESMAGTGKVIYNGLDISEHQKGLDLKKVKAAGYNFVILRIGIRLKADNSIRKDYQFETFYKQARELGLHVGGYFYTRAKTEAEAIEEANKTLEYIKGKRFEYPIYLDFEDGNDTWKTRNSSTAATAKKVCYAYMNQIKSAGYLTGLYGYAAWFDDGYNGWMSSNLNNDIGKKYEFWMANYYNHSPSNTKAAKYPTKYGMYQYTSSKTISGWSGKLDANVSYKDYPAIVSKYGFNGYSVGEKITPQTMVDIPMNIVEPQTTTSKATTAKKTTAKKTQKKTTAADELDETLLLDTLPMESASETGAGAEAGCGSAVGVGATLIALASIGGAAIVVKRKRED